jgi:hypothetical protein
MPLVEMRRMSSFKRDAATVFLDTMSTGAGPSRRNQAAETARRAGTISRQRSLGRRWWTPKQTRISRDIVPKQVPR